jgi:hypothetical protein
VSAGLISSLLQVTLIQPERITSDDQQLAWNWPGDSRRHWFRAGVRGADGKLWLLGNPVYINWQVENRCAEKHAD